jgi:hypothetical protein
MPTTSNFGWTTPADTDLVKDGAAAIRTLGNGIDTSLVDLKGGTTGQVLSKNSNTDLDFTWVAQDDSNAIQNALLTTTGDTIYASGASTPARLGIGTTGQVLTVNGGVPSWQNAATGDKAALYPNSSGRFIKQFTREGNTNRTLTEDVTYYVPIYLPGYALDRIGFATSTNATNTIWRLGIYNASTTTGLPTTVYLDAGTVNATATSTDYTITIASTPPAGYYYFAINVQTVTSGSREIIAVSQTYINDRPFAPTSNSGQSVTFWSGFTQSGVTGAFGTATSLTVDTTQQPLVYARIA